ncbi:MAG: tRNA (guanosine(46)-N7)-methyltransferase TrmB [Pseudomonadota bacterium]
MSETEKTAARPIRSFIRRQGRITQAQQAALETLWPNYGLDPGARLTPEAVFSRRAPLVLEIGFGNGESLAETAAAHPEKDYIGIEVHKPGLGHLMLRLKAMSLRNVRIYCFDAIEILAHRLPDSSLSGINLFFPDPWPKKKHHKRRILTPEFAELAVAKLKTGGIFHAATDWEDYAEQMLSVLEKTSRLENTAGARSLAPRPGDRPMTNFERRGLRLGHGVWDLIFRCR